MWKRVDILKDLVREYGKLVITSSEFTLLLDDKGFFEGGDGDFRDIVSALHRSGFGTVLYRISQRSSAEIEGEPRWRDMIINHVNAFCANTHYDSSKVHYAAEVLTRGVLPSDCFSIFGGVERLFPDKTLPQEILLSLDDMPISEESVEEEGDLPSPPRKSRINLEKTYPPEYLERQRKRKKQQGVEKANDSFQKAHDSFQKADTASQKPDTATSTGDNITQTPNDPSYTSYSQATKTSQNKDGNTGIAPSMAGTLSTASVKSTNYKLVITNISNSGTKPSFNKNNKRKKKPTSEGNLFIIGIFIFAILIWCFNWYVKELGNDSKTIKNEIQISKYTTWHILDHVDLSTRKLDSYGRKLLSASLQKAPEDIWLNFIARMDEVVRSPEHKNTIRCLNLSSYPPNDVIKPKYIPHEYIHFQLETKEYLGKNDYTQKNGHYQVDKEKAQNAIRQFMIDACLPSDAKISSKAVDELLSVWNPSFTTKDIGVRSLYAMEREPGTDSDKLIKLLQRSGFYNPLISLRLSPLQQFYKPKEHSKICNILAKAGSKMDIHNAVRFYNVPSELETCLRVFQAYHGIKPDGELNAETVARLKEYE